MKQKEVNMNYLKIIGIAVLNFAEIILVYFALSYLAFYFGWVSHKGNWGFASGLGTGNAIVYSFFAYRKQRDKKTRF